VKLLKRQEARPASRFNSRPPEPTGMLAALKRGAYDKAMDALEPIYQRAKKLAKQAEQVLQKSQRLQSRPTAGHTPSSTGRPGLVQRKPPMSASMHRGVSKRARGRRPSRPDSGSLNANVFEFWLSCLLPWTNRLLGEPARAKPLNPACFF
jgi:hypothetical protein